MVQDKRPPGRPPLSWQQHVKKLEDWKVHHKAEYLQKVAAINLKMQTVVQSEKSSQDDKENAVNHSDLQLKIEAMIYARTKRMKQQALESMLDDGGDQSVVNGLILQASFAPAAGAGSTLQFSPPQSQVISEPPTSSMEFTRGAYADLNKARIRAVGVGYLTTENTIIRGFDGITQITQESISSDKYVPTFMSKSRAVPMNLDAVIKDLCKMPPHKLPPTCSFRKRPEGAKVMYLATFVTWLHALLWHTRKRDGLHVLQDTHGFQPEAAAKLMLSLDVFKIGTGAGDRDHSEYSRTNSVLPAKASGASRTASLNSKIRGFASTQSAYKASAEWLAAYRQLFADTLLRAPEADLLTLSESDSDDGSASSTVHVYLMKPQVVMLVQRLTRAQRVFRESGLEGNESLEACEERLRVEFKRVNGCQPGADPKSLPFLGDTARAYAETYASEKYTTGKEYFQVLWADDETLQELFLRVENSFTNICDQASFKGMFCSASMVWYCDPRQSDAFPWASAAAGETWHNGVTRIKMTEPEDASDCDEDEENEDGDEDSADAAYQVGALEIRQNTLDDAIQRMAESRRCLKDSTLQIFRAAHTDTSILGLRWVRAAYAAAAGDVRLVHTELLQKLTAQSTGDTCVLPLAEWNGLLVEGLSHASVVEGTTGDCWRPAPSALMIDIREFLARYGPAPPFIAESGSMPASQSSAGGM